MASSEKRETRLSVPLIVVEEMGHRIRHSVHAVSFEIHFAVLSVVVLERDTQELVVPVSVMVEGTARRVIAFIHVNQAGSSKVVFPFIVWRKSPVDIDVLWVTGNLFEPQRFKILAFGLESSEHIRVVRGQSSVQATFDRVPPHRCKR